MAANTAKQLNMGVTILPYAILGKTTTEDNSLSTVFGASADLQKPTAHEGQPFTPKHGRLRTAARIFLGKIHTKERVIGDKATLSYRQITEQSGHSSRTTSNNIKQLTALKYIESPAPSTYHITQDYDAQPFLMLYDWLCTDEILLPNGSQVKLTDLQAMILSVIVNHTFNKKKKTPFHGSLRNIEKTHNVPHSTAQSALNRLIELGLIITYRQYINDEGNVIEVKNDKARSKSEKTLLSTISTVLRPCAVIYKEYQRKQDSQRRAEKRNTSRRADKTKPETPLSDHEKFDELEAKFIRDSKYMKMTERYKALRVEALDVLLKTEDEAQFDSMLEEADKLFNDLCRYLADHGVTPDKIPKDFKKILYTEIKA